MIKILDVKAHATVQDLGRTGLRKWGIGQAGAMDRLALQAGNLLLGNAPDLAAIEVPLGRLTLEFQQDTNFCVTGAFYEMQLDDKPVYSYWRYAVKAGQRLTMVRAKIGMYGYLCVQGGINVPLEQGSRSTDLRAQLGGINGRALQENDILPCDEQAPLSEIGIAPIPLSNDIRLLASSEYEAFKLKSLYHFWQKKWTLQSNSDRIGYRFQGEALQFLRPLEMLSHAVQFGTVQVPPNGQPIILMADAQTTGGYPKIATVIEADLGLLAQVRLGSAVQFHRVDLAQAEKARLKNEVYLNHIRRIVNENR